MHSGKMSTCAGGSLIEAGAQLRYEPIALVARPIGPCGTGSRARRLRRFSGSMANAAPGQDRAAVWYDFGQDADGGVVLMSIYTTGQSTYGRARQISTYAICGE